MSHKLGWVTAAFMLLLGGWPSARADVVTFTLENLTFSDGGTASGSFSLDLTTDLVTSNNITTTTVGGFPGTNYATAPPANFFEHNTNNPPSDDTFIPIGFDSTHFFNFEVVGFPPSLTAASPIRDGTESNGLTLFRETTGGSIAPAAARPHRRCWTARPAPGKRWTSRLVATAAEERLTYSQ